MSIRSFSNDDEDEAKKLMGQQNDGKAFSTYLSKTSMTDVGVDLGVAILYAVVSKDSDYTSSAIRPRFISSPDKIIK